MLSLYGENLAQMWCGCSMQIHLLPVIAGQDVESIPQYQFLLANMPTACETLCAYLHAGSVIRNQRYSDAVSLLLRYAEACDASNAKSSQCRAYLGAVVVQLYAENASEAWQVYQVGVAM